MVAVDEIKLGLFLKMIAVHAAVLKQVIGSFISYNLCHYIALLLPDLAHHTMPHM